MFAYNHTPPQERGVAANSFFALEEQDGYVTQRKNASGVRRFADVLQHSLAPTMVHADVERAQIPSLSAEQSFATQRMQSYAETMPQSSSVQTANYQHDTAKASSFGMRVRNDIVRVLSAAARIGHTARPPAQTMPSNAVQMPYLSANANSTSSALYPNMAPLADPASGGGSDVGQGNLRQNIYASGNVERTFQPITPPLSWGRSEKLNR